jgi:hypothetical protein
MTISKMSSSKIVNSTALNNSPFIQNALSKNNIRLFLDPSFTSSYAGSGTAWNDLSGNNRNATLVGSPAHTGLGLTFGSTNTYADLSGGTGNPAGDWSHSYMMWVKPTITQDNMAGAANTIWFMGSPVGNGTSSFEMYGNPLFRWYFYSNDADYTSGNIFTTTNWYHLSLTYSGGGVSLANKRFYVNGVPLRIDAPGSGSLNIAANAPLYIGKDVPRNAGFWNGQIGQFAIYDGVVSKKQIQDNFNATRSKYGI